MGSTYDASSLEWISRLRPRSAVRVDRAHIAYEGWVWKKSKHLSVSRRRWLVLAVDGQLLTFEDDRQTSGATGRWILSGEPPALYNGGGDSSSQAFSIEVKYPSKRKAALNL